MYMCVDIQYEWEGFSSCKRPIHKARSLVILIMLATGTNSLIANPVKTRPNPKKLPHARQWLLLSYGLVVMSRIVHVSGALMPGSRHIDLRRVGGSRLLPLAFTLQP